MNILIDNITIKIRDNLQQQDMDVVNEVIAGDCYKVCDLPIPIHSVIDVGAHIGTFALKVHERQPHAKIICIDIEEDNIDLCKINVDEFANVVHAAATYVKGPLRLFSCMFGESKATCGSFISMSTELGNYQSQDKDKSIYLLEKQGMGLPVDYMIKELDIPRLTIENIMNTYGFETLDLLKLDCEGSELSILENCSCIEKIGVIIGEWHDKNKFHEIVEKRFDTKKWAIDYLSPANELGIFRLTQRKWHNMN